MKPFRLLYVSAGLALAVSGSAVLSCASGGGGFEPIVIDFSATKTPAAPPPTATPTPVPPPVEKPKASAPSASVPAADLTPPPREKPEPTAAEPDSPGSLIARHREALDRGDLDTALAMYAPDARIEPEPAGRGTGRDAIVGYLSDQVKSSPPAEGRQRTESGPYVTERITGAMGGLAVYEVRNGKIVRVRFFR